MGLAYGNKLSLIDFNALGERVRVFEVERVIGREKRSSYLAAVMHL